MKKKFLIDGSTPIDPVRGGCWRVVDEEGVVYAECYGPSSLLIATAACEKLNTDFDYDGWMQRTQDNMISVP